MPPKQSKADVAKKQKVVEDKTFGLKNKNKSKAVQKYVKNIQSSAQPKVDPKMAAKVSLHSSFDLIVCVFIQVNKVFIFLIRIRIVFLGVCMSTRIDNY